MKPQSRPLIHCFACFGLLCGTVLIQAFHAGLETRLEVNGLASEAGYGTHVAVSGDRIVVGAAGAIINGVRSGAAYVFTRENAAWIAEAELTPNDPVLGSRFGYAVDMSGDTIVVGAYGDNQYGTYAGAAYVFVRGENGWIQQAKLTPVDTHSWLQFGDPVAIDGDRLVVGAIADSAFASYSGAAYVFVRQDSQWVQETKLKAGVPRANSYFGYSLAIQGDTICAGAPFSNLGGNVYAGSVCVFERTDQVWSQTAELWTSEPASYQFLGWSVALSESTLVAGAPMASGVVPVGGAAYLFSRNSSGWNQTTMLQADDAAGGDWFGYSVALSGGVAAVGSSQDSTFGHRSGSVYLFSRSDGHWSQGMEFSAHDVTPGDQFGYGLAFDGLTLAVGAPDKAVNGAWGAGAAYAFTSVPANEPPVADASATVSPVIASPNGSAWVTLDPSQSYDLDDDPLDFEWYLGDAWLATGAMATIQLGIGTHLITLHVSDGTLSTTDTIAVEVISASEAIGSVVDQLAQSSIPKGQATALTTMLQLAVKALVRGQTHQAIHHLDMFQNQLRVHSDRQIDPDIAQSLHLQTQAIRNALK
jgi:hypothetical protein